jgi:acetyltransferase-like isoleucine patch superfamily enzyme
MKSFLKKLMFSKFSKQIIKLFALLLGYKTDIFRSKYFESEYVGYYWLLKSLWFQRIIGFNRFIGYPLHPTVTLTQVKNLSIHVDSINNLMSPGCYFQCSRGKITIDKNVYIGPNTGLITANHNSQQPEKHLNGMDIKISENCWIGMNCVILPGVVLGPNTTVAAGSVVTKSYPEGFILLAGSPATVKKELKLKSGYEIKENHNFNG